MSEEKKIDIINVPIINPFSLMGIFDEFILRFTPSKYRGVAKHYIKAKIEMLKALREIIDMRIKDLESLITEEKEVKKEKVKLE